MRKRNIALIGYRATGKSTVGKILADVFGREFIDMDHRLTVESGRDIAKWVEEEGWEAFRRAESGLLKIIGLQQGLVVATGGGIVLDPENRNVLRESFLNIWLKALPQTICERICSDPESPRNRPAFSDLPMLEEIEKVLSEREAFYSEIADISIDTPGKQAIQVAEEILKAISELKLDVGNRGECRD